MNAESSSGKGKRARRELEESDYVYDAGHTREIEHKRERGLISCAECRRLKIKCDKQIPCNSCKRRGCEKICPNGSLSTGQGTRFVLEATEHLHRRVAKMQTRIRQLEDALSAAHAENHVESHPLLSSDITVEEPEVTEERPVGAVPNESSTISEILGFFGTLSMSEDGVAQFFGPTGSSESLLADPPSDRRPSARYETGATHLPSPIDASSMEAYPFSAGPPMFSQAELENRLPSHDRALHLAGVFMEKAAWVFSCVSREQLYEDVLPAFYPESQTGRQLGSPDKGEGPSSGAHDLALLFTILAIGTLLDFDDHPAESFPPPNPEHLAEGEVYRQMSRNALGLVPVFQNPTIPTIQTLHLLSVHNAMSGVDVADMCGGGMAASWALFNVSAHLGQTIGLHRDSSRWGLSPKMVKRRRLLFEDMFLTDAWHSLATGRPPSFSLSFVDTSSARNLDPPPSDTGDLGQLSFQDWAFRFAVDCVSQIALRLLATEAPTYATITELDKLLRNYPRPPSITPPDTATVGKFMRTYTLDYITEVAMLYVHREFFGQAIAEFPENPLKSAYSASVLASYRAAVTVLHAVVTQFAAKPALCARFWTRMTFAFSAANVFATIVNEAPLCALAKESLVELDSACLMFSRAALHSRRAAKAFSILAKLNSDGKRKFEDARLRSKAALKGKAKVATGGGNKRPSVVDDVPEPSSSTTHRHTGSHEDISPTLSSDSHRSYRSFESPQDTESSFPMSNQWDRTEAPQPQRPQSYDYEYNHMSALPEQHRFQHYNATTLPPPLDQRWSRGHAETPMDGVQQWQSSFSIPPDDTSPTQYLPWQSQSNPALALYQNHSTVSSSSEMGGYSSENQYPPAIDRFPDYSPLRLVPPVQLADTRGQPHQGMQHEYPLPEQRVSQRRSNSSFYGTLGP